jgi:phosphoribosylamine--glycine ligase
MPIVIKASGLALGKGA